MGRFIKSLGIAEKITEFKIWLALKIVGKEELMWWVVKIGTDAGEIGPNECLYCKKYIPKHPGRNNPYDHLHIYEKYGIGVSCPFCNFWVTLINRYVHNLVNAYMYGRKDWFAQGVEDLSEHIEKGKTIDWFDKHPYVVKDEASCDAHWKEYNKWPQFAKKNEK